MRKKTALAVGIILIVAGSVGSVAVYQETESGSSFLSVAGQGLVTKNLEATVAQSRGGDVSVIVSYDPVSKGLNASSLSVRGQELKSLAVRNLSVYGFTLAQEETIPAFGMVVGKAPAENVDRIAKSPRVRAVARNSFISVGDAGLFEGYSDIEEVKTYHEIESLPSAEGKVVCVIDSKSANEDWVDNAVSIRGEKPYSGYWHGEYVAEVVHGVAPEADITAVKVLDEYGTGRISTILKGIEKATTMRPKTDVVNLSLGGASGIYNPMDVACETLEREYGIKVVCAAGNTGGKGETSPATSKSTLSVGALTPEGSVADYSAGEYDVLAVGNVNVNYRDIRGTSFASPVVAGMTARWMILHESIPAGDIDAKKSIINSVKLLQESGEELPIVKGSEMSETDVSTKSAPIDNALPFIVMSIVGVVAVFWGVEEGRK